MQAWSFQELIMKKIVNNAGLKLSAVDYDDWDLCEYCSNVVGDVSQCNVK